MKQARPECVTGWSENRVRTKAGQVRLEMRSAVRSWCGGGGGRTRSGRGWRAPARRGLRNTSRGGEVSKTLGWVSLGTWAGAMASGGDRIGEAVRSLREAEWRLLAGNRCGESPQCAVLRPLVLLAGRFREGGRARRVAHALREQTLRASGAEFVPSVARVPVATGLRRFTDQRAPLFLGDVYVGRTDTTNVTRTSLVSRADLGIIYARVSEVACATRRRKMGRRTRPRGRTTGMTHSFLTTDQRCRACRAPQFNVCLPQIS